MVESLCFPVFRRFPRWRAVTQLGSGSWSMVNQVESPLTGPLNPTVTPLRCLGTPLAQTLLLILWCQGSWDPPRILSISLPEHLSGSNVSHWSRFLRAPVLPSRALSLSSSQLLKAASLLPFIFSYLPSDSLLCNSYLAKTDHFSTCRVPDILFLYPRLNLWVFRILW